MNKELQNETREIFNGMYKVLSKYKDNQLDIIPFESSWTPGQVCEHIIKANAGIPKLCQGRTETAETDRVERISDLKAIFENYAFKMDSPKSIIPFSTENNLNDIISTLKNIESDFLAVIETLNLELICMDFAFPTFGYLTRAEWIKFGLIHTKRHSHQLENILLKIDAI